MSAETLAPQQNPESATGEALAAAFGQIVADFRAILEVHGPDSPERYRWRDAYTEQLKAEGLSQAAVNRLYQQALTEVHNG